MARGFNYAPGSRPLVHEATRPDLTKAQLLELGSHKNMAVRAAVANREDCPLGLMVTLAHDHSVEVRVSVASNPAAMRSVMQYLSGDKSIDVVLAVIANPALPADLLEELAFHKKPQVSRAAQERLNEIAEAAAAKWDAPAQSHDDVARVAVAPGPPPRIEDDAVDIVEFETAVPLVEDVPVVVHPFLAPHEPQPHQVAHRTAPVRGFTPPVEPEYR